MDMKKEVPPALVYFNNLYRSKSSPQLIEYFETLKNPKPFTLEVFAKGIQEFAKLANLSAEERKIFFSNQFYGLHYNDQLAELWNSNSTEKVDDSKLIYLCPPNWEAIFAEGYGALIYKGNFPSAALNTLLQGPTTIDCEMFCLLCIWFGLRYMLGNKIFNYLFGNTPFHLTQNIYTDIIDLRKPYLGNPLYPFFIQDSEIESGLCIVHTNGNLRSRNCVLFNGKYTTFDPSFKITSDLNLADIAGLKQKLRFDLEKFNLWVLQRVTQAFFASDYIPLKNYQMNVPPYLFEKIPFENRSNMSFSNFLVNTQLQKNIKSVALSFCHLIMNDQPCSVILSGESGIGKTSVASACAKELASRGKKVVWLSEIMINVWAAQTKSLDEVEAIAYQLKLLLEKNVDIYFRFT
jgi:hypothetical protein